MTSFHDLQGIPEIPPNLPELIGPQLIGLWFNWALLGALFVQVYIYYLCFPRDPKYTQSLVYILFLAEIAQTCLATNDAINWLVYWWGRPDMLGSEALSWFDVPIMTGIISCTVQISFAWRIWRLSESWLLAGVTIVLSLLQSSAAIAVGIQAHKVANFSFVTAKLVPSFSVWMASSAFVDILIAVSMTYLLTRSKNGFRHTDYLITRLVRLAIETGSVTAVVATVDLILFTASKNTNLFIVPTTALAKLYTNSLMVVFNNRVFMRAPKPISTLEDTSHTAEPDSVDFYRSRIRAAISSSGSATGVMTFRDMDTLTERSREGERDIPLDPFPSHVHYTGSKDELVNKSQREL